MAAAKVAIKKEKAKPVLTTKSCAKCGERMMSDKISTVFTVTFVGAKRSSLFVHRHKGCQ